MGKGDWAKKTLALVILVSAASIILISGLITVAVIFGEHTRPSVLKCEDQITTSSDSPQWDPPTFSDNIKVAKVSSSNDIGSPLDYGIHNITYTATDLAGNSASCSFYLTVIAIKDCIPPQAADNTIQSCLFTGWGVACDTSCIPNTYTWASTKVPIVVCMTDLWWINGLSRPTPYVFPACKPANNDPSNPTKCTQSDLDTLTSTLDTYLRSIFSEAQCAGRTPCYYNGKNAVKSCGAIT